MPKPLIWTPKKVNVEDLVENPNNPKITSEKGKKRLKNSMRKFGVAGTIVCNLDLLIIDGHSRKADLIEQGVTEVWVSLPNRKLTKKEYDEINAIFDLAKAGETDMQMVEEILTEDQLEEWDLTRKEKEGREVSFNVNDKQFFLNIECEDEAHAQQLYERLSSEGLTVKIVT